VTRRGHARKAASAEAAARLLRFCVADRFRDAASRRGFANVRSGIRTFAALRHPL
jgi:hypothetical protein